LPEAEPRLQWPGHLVGQRLHARSRQRRDSAREHPGQQQHEAVGRASVVLQQDAGQEPVEHAAHDPVHAVSVERGGPVDIVARCHQVRQRGPATRA
jgi:hypothetical protein